jgi:HK97 family phage major capsid protein
MPASDSMIARLESEHNDRNSFVEGLIASAEDAGRDLSTQELELIGNARNRIEALESQLVPLRETAAITQRSRQRMRDLDRQFSDQRRRVEVGEVEYRSASQYMLDRWRAGLRMEDAMERLELFHRAAAHQTTADNPGIIPSTLLEPIINYLDAARPLTAALGVRQIPGNGFVSRVTQHTQVGKQSAEKAELPSRKMLITKTALAPDTFGGYVNVSRQDIDWSDPNALDVVIEDLTGQYAIETEGELCDVLVAGATGTETYPAGTPTAATISAALWGAVGEVYTATQGAGGGVVVAIAPNMLGTVGPLFNPVNPQNAQSTGFNAGAFGQGVQGAISGVSVVMSAGLAAGSFLVISRGAVSVYEDRLGALQVVEPSVLGVQVAYAGYFKPYIKEPAGIVEVTQAA